MLFMLFYAMCKKSGTIPIYNDSIIMVDSLKHSDRLVLPKGKVKPHETLVEAAIRETDEEAGVLGTILENRKFVYKNVTYFILQVTDVEKDYKELKKRKRHFIKFKDIRSTKNIHEGLKNMILNSLSMFTNKVI